MYHYLETNFKNIKRHHEHSIGKIFRERDSIEKLYVVVLEQVSHVWRDEWVSKPQNTYFVQNNT